jgi:hypothetical protein
MCHLTVPAKTIRSVAVILFVGLFLSAGLLVLAQFKLNSSLSLTGIESNDTAATESRPPTIIWSEPRILVNLSPGETLSKSVTFTSTFDLLNVSVEPVPEVANFLKIESNLFPQISANQPNVVQMNFNISSTTAVGMYEGTVHLRNGRRTLPQTLKVIINVVWQTVSDTNHGFTINYPIDWFVRQSPDALVFSSTLSERTLEGDPGDEITIVVFPRDGFTTILDWLKQRYEGEIEINSNSTETVENSFGVRFMKLHNAPDLSSDNIHAFVMTDEQVIQISITPASHFPGVYDAMLNTFRTN